MARPLRIEFEGACYLRHAPINGQPDRLPMKKLLSQGQCTLHDLTPVALMHVTRPDPCSVEADGLSFRCAPGQADIGTLTPCFASI